METVHAIYENGVFRPTGPIAIPEKSEVKFELQIVSSPADSLGANTAAIHEILSRRFESGHHDTAERHNEHQP